MGLVLEDFPRSLTSNRKLSVIRSRFSEQSRREQRLRAQIRGTSHTHTVMAARKPIVCGLSAGGIIPPLPRVNTDDGVEDIPPTEAELVEISDDEEEDLVELSSDEYRRNMGYLIRVEEEADDIPPEFREGERGEVQGVEGGNQARRGTILYV